MNPASSEISGRELRIIFVALVLALSLATLDQTIVNTALPRMASDLGGLGHISWVVTAFLLTSTFTTPIYGKLSDMYGRRRPFIISISLFLLASALCGTAQTMAQLILFRALQGLGAGGLITLSQTVMADVVAPRDRARYQGLISTVFAVSSVAGPLIGGALTTALSWRWVFYVNLPLGGCALVLIMIGLPKSEVSRAQKIDYAGAMLLAGASTFLLLLLSWGGSTIAWTSATAVALGIGAAVLMLLFVRQEMRAAQPIIDLGLFRIRTFATGVAASGMMTFAMMGALVFLPLYYQLVFGMNPAKAGIMLLPQIVMMIFSSVIGGRLASRHGGPRRFLLLGMALQASGLAVLGILAFVGAGISWFLCTVAMLGLGMGIGMPNATVIIQDSVSGAAMGVAMATMSFIRSLGGALGVASSGGIMAAGLARGLHALGGAKQAHGVIEAGIGHIALLPDPAREVVIAAYRSAIGTSFTFGAAVMAAAFLAVLTIRTTRIAAEVA